MIDITPEIKIAVLLEAYPQLEEVLIKAAPPFAKLRNPLLRKTVARVTTLRQAALVGGIDLADLINTLRKAAGMDNLNYYTKDEKLNTGAKPEWLNPDNIAWTTDARPMIQKGEQPIGTIMRQLNEIPSGKALELLTPFIPAPLIDKAREKGFVIWYDKEATDIFRTYFYRP